MVVNSVAVRCTLIQFDLDTVTHLADRHVVRGRVSFVVFEIIDLPCVGSRVVRIDPLRFLAGCRTRRLNQV